MTEETDVNDSAINASIEQQHRQVGERVANMAFDRCEGDFDMALDFCRDGLIKNTAESRELRLQSGYPASPVTGRWELAMVRGMLETAEKRLGHAMQ